MAQSIYNSWRRETITVLLLKHTLNIEASIEAENKRGRDARKMIYFSEITLLGNTVLAILEPDSGDFSSLLCEELLMNNMLGRAPPQCPGPRDLDFRS